MRLGLALGLSGRQPIAGIAPPLNPPPSPRFGSTTQRWGDVTTPLFGKTA